MEEGVVTSEGLCRCPQVPVSSSGRARGRVKHCPGAGGLLSPRWVFPAGGAGWVPKAPSRGLGAGLGALNWDSHMRPNRSGCHMPGRRGTGAQETGWRTGSSQMTLGVPKGLAPRCLPPAAGHKPPPSFGWLSQAPCGQEGPGWGGQSLHSLQRYPRSIPWGGGCWRDPDRAWQRREVQQPRAERAELLPHPLLWDSPGALRVPG